jgi:hypothetical protein
VSGSIVGVVRGGTTAQVPLAGAAVLLHRGRGYIGHTLTDARGRFEFVGLQAGEYHLGFDGSTSTTPGSWASPVRRDRSLHNPTRVELIDGEVRTIEATVPCTAIIRGRITDAARPSLGVPNVIVGYNSETCLASPGGYFSFVAQPGSAYILSFGTRGDPAWREQWWENGRNASRATPVVPREGQTLVINVLLKRTAVRP